MAYFVHIANVLYLVSYLVRDILWLRFLTVIAIFTLMPYFYFQDKVLWAPIGWNVLFVGINAYQIYRLLLARRPVALSETEQTLYALAFTALTPRQFKKLADCAERRDLDGGDAIITRGHELDELMVVYDGELAVEVEGNAVASLEPGKLVGEMAYATGRTPSADVRPVGDAATVFCWKHGDLDAILSSDPDLRAAWQRLVIGDLTGKLVGRPSQ